jgi:hypothetical protein
VTFKPKKPLKDRTAQLLANSLKSSKLLALTTLTLAGVQFAAACAPEPTEPAKTSLAGTWTAPNAHLYALSNFRLEIIQEPNGIVSGQWFVKRDAGSSKCEVATPCNAVGELIGRNTVSQVELELLGAGKFEGGLIEAGRMRGIFAVQESYDTITFVRAPVTLAAVNR